MFPLAWLPSSTNRLKPGKHAQKQSATIGSTYSFLKGVDEVLQVNVITVGSDVALKELPEPVPHPVLE